MIEKFMIASGLGCGTKKNFQTEIRTHLDLNDFQRWYYLTPIKQTGTGLISVKINLAFPFLKIDSDIDEKAAIERITDLAPSYVKDLIFHFEKYGFIVPVDSIDFYVIADYSGASNEREERNNLGAVSIHIVNVVMTVKYREHWIILHETITPEVQRLTLEQQELEVRLNTIVSFIASPDFEVLDQETKDLYTAQQVAMNDYNEALKARILLLTQ